jgi:ABC-type Fe3+/spermidine/putrescine transport system ATPase subunit
VSALRIEALTVVLGDVIVLDALDLEVMQGESVALLGPSGSGKTTLLYAVAGLVEPMAGQIEIAGEQVGPHVGPEHRSIGMVFQNYALWPHLDARSTVAYPLLRRGIDQAEAHARADALLELVGIGELGERVPDRLSGGQQQRVGLARALAGDPSLYLFDEPTAHLDAGVREALQSELLAQRERTGAASLYTTHDAAEAMAVADRVAVLQDGRIVQIGSPVEVYERPVDVKVAVLTGPMSVIPAVLTAVGQDRIDVTVGNVEFKAAGGAATTVGLCSLIVRPDWAVLGGPIGGIVRAVRYEGPHTDYVVAFDGGEVRIRRAGPPALDIGDTTGWAVTRGWAIAT